jgi:hypothetical protein
MMYLDTPNFMNNKDKKLNISKKTTVKIYDPSVKFQFDLDSIYGLFKVKFISCVKYFWSVTTIIKNFRKYLKFNELKNSKKNKKLLILGGGPSLLKLEKIKNYKLKKNFEVMGMAYFNKYSNIKLIPNYIISADNTFLVQNSSRKFMKKNIFTKSKNKNILKYIQKHNINLFLPLEYSNTYKHLKINANFFLSRNSIFFTKNINPLFPLGVPPMSFFYALSIGIFMGYKEIYLLGLDNTYPKDVWVDDKNKLYNIERYAKEFYLSDQSMRYKNITSMYYEISMIFYGLNLYKQFQDKVFNLDDFSLTNIFKKKNFDKILK